MEWVISPFVRRVFGDEHNDDPKVGVAIAEERRKNQEAVSNITLSCRRKSV
jgi:hypothetical protein